MTPEQEEQVRRTLASVPAEPGVPPEVAARLDATLAGLVAEREPQVDELEQRRRRRWPRILVAAASVAVLGYGAGVVLDGLQVSGGDASSTAARDETFAGAGAGGAESQDKAAPDAPGVLPPSAGAGAGAPDSGSLDSSEASKARSARALTGQTVRLQRDALAGDVRRLLDSTTLVDGQAPRSESARKQRSAADLIAPCATPAIGRGDRYAPARLDGIRATLVVRRGADGIAVAEVYACDDPTRLLAAARLGE